MSRCHYIDPRTGEHCSLEAECNRDYCRDCAKSVSEERERFRGWMQKVTQALEAYVGLHPDDLPDCPYADWHAAGMEPIEAARQAIVACGDDFDGVFA